jgi:hypothetical protein|nr:MAG TPA: Sec61beta family [Crassvirales sp.]
MCETPAIVERHSGSFLFIDVNSPVEEVIDMLLLLMKHSNLIRVAIVHRFFTGDKTSININENIILFFSIAFLSLI